MAPQTGTVFGAEVIHHGPLSKSHISTLASEKPSMESLSSAFATPATEHPPMPNTYDPVSSNPCSAFYSHPTTRTSFEQRKSESKVNIQVYHHDLESGARVAHSMYASGNEKNPVWPCKSQLLRQESEMRRSRTCGPFKSMTKKQKLITQILLALLVIGAVFGLGIGVAKATNSGIYKNPNSQTSIAGTN